MAPLGDGAHPQPNIEEYTHKASLTAARERERVGGGGGIMHYLKDTVDMKINYDCHRIKGTGQVTVTQMKSAFLRAAKHSGSG